MATKRSREESFPFEEKAINHNDHVSVMTDDDAAASEGSDSSPRGVKISRGRTRDSWDICVGHHVEDANVPVYVRGSSQNTNTVRYRAFEEDLDETVSQEMAILIRRKPTVSRSKVVFVAENFADYQEIDLAKFGRLDEMTDAQKTELAKLVVYAGEEAEETINLNGMDIRGDLLWVGHYTHDHKVAVFAYLTRTTIIPMLKFRALEEDIERSPYQIKKNIDVKSIKLLAQFKRGDEKGNENEKSKKYIRKVLLFIRDHENLAPTQTAPTGLTQIAPPAANITGMMTPPNFAQLPITPARTTSAISSFTGPWAQFGATSSALNFHSARMDPTVTGGIAQRFTQAGSVQRGILPNISPLSFFPFFCAAPVNAAVQGSATGIQTPVLANGGTPLASHQPVAATTTLQTRLASQNSEIASLRAEINSLRTDNDVLAKHSVQQDFRRGS